MDESVLVKPPPGGSINLDKDEIRPRIDIAGSTKSMVEQYVHSSLNAHSAPCAFSYGRTHRP